MIRRLERPYAPEEIDASLTPLVRSWFSSRFPGYSPPQLFSILNIKRRLNTLISSPTGSGKTLSAFLAVLDDLALFAQDGTLEDRVYCIYISPLKALGNDIEKNLERPLAELEELSDRPLGIRVGVRTGDTPVSERRKMLKTPPHILITTPESFSLMLTTPKFSEALARTEWVIIDEIHALADNKRGTQLSLALERLHAKAPFTRIGLSATVAPLEEVGEYLVGREGGAPRDCDIVDVNFTKKLDFAVMSPVENLIAASHDEITRKQFSLIDDLVQKHKTTLIFTNTRAATERVVHQLRRRFPSHYTDRIAAVDDASDEVGEVRTTIAAHHGSLSKDHRLRVEQQLRDGKLRCVVSSTSLELGIDIGYIDLVILLGSPKSVARALQRVGRSGHKLHETAKGRIVVLDRDDLVESAVLARAALRKQVDRIHIPKQPLDVLSQEIYGMLIDQRQSVRQLFSTITAAYPYRDLGWKDFDAVLRYLAGEHATLEDRHVYAKIWYDEETEEAGRRGKMARVIYSTNIGTIPDQTDVVVKVGSMPVGSLSEPFLESLKPGDIFVLGGDTYQFRFSRGMTAQVQSAEGRRPTVPSWFSEMLPLSYDLAGEIRRFRGHVDDLLSAGRTKKECLEWITGYLPVDDAAARSIYEYCSQQFRYAVIPHDRRIVIEYYTSGDNRYTIFHTLYGRRANDVLARAVAFALGKLGSGDVEIGLSDNGFSLRYRSHVPAGRAFKLLSTHPLREVMLQALDKSEVLRRRFRHCAGRALMILRTYRGNKKSVGRQQVSSQLLLSAVKRIGPDFPILREAQREVLEDLMDIDGAAQVLAGIQSGALRVEEIHTDLPSPFAFSLILQGYADVMRVEERQEFLRRMHREVLAKLSLKTKKEDIEELLGPQDFSYEAEWESEEHEKRLKAEDDHYMLVAELHEVADSQDVEPTHVYDLQRVLAGDTKGFSREFLPWLSGRLEARAFPERLQRYLTERLPSLGWA